MTPGFQGASRLSVHRAFVVHFATGGNPRRRRFQGRVEHLSSGRTARFSSLAQLLEFVADVVDGSGAPVPRSSIDGNPTENKPATARSSKTRAGRTGVVGGPRRRQPAEGRDS